VIGDRALVSAKLQLYSLFHKNAARSIDRSAKRIDELQKEKIEDQNKIIYGISIEETRGEMLPD
jgi:hypothetical protein